MSGCPLVCLHGWCCRADHFKAQAVCFSGDRRVISMPWQSDLGSQGAPVDLATAARLVESACVAERLEQPPVLVGHSMGGMLAAMIARDGIVPVRAIVVIDATWPLDQASSDFFESFVPGLESDFQSSIRDFFNARLTAPSDDPDINAAIIDEVAQSDPEVALAIFRDLQTPGRLPSVEEVPVPIMGISSSLRFLDRDNLLRHAPDAWYGQVPGVGHFIMQQAPSQLNAMLASFLDHLE